MNIKIVDFGFSVKMRNLQDTSKNFCGTPSFLAPEIVNKKEHSPFKADIWALGVVLYKLLTNKYPFEGKNDVQLYSRINKGIYEVDKSLSQGVVFILNKMIRKDLEMRYTAQDLMNDSWVISGPLITAPSYFLNPNTKSVLSKSLGSRNNIHDFSKRPGTTAANVYGLKNRRTIVAESAGRIPSKTQYTGFGNLRYNKTLDCEDDDDKNSVSIKLKPQLSIQESTQTNFHRYEQEMKQDIKPSSAYFKPALKKQNSSSRPNRQISFKGTLNDDSYCMNTVTHREKPM